MGNKVLGKYAVEEGNQIASGGPGFLWKIYPAKCEATGQPVSVFIFEKDQVLRPHSIVIRCSRPTAFSAQR